MKFLTTMKIPTTTLPLTTLLLIQLATALPTPNAQQDLTIKPR